jgi:hypothetical protein
MEDALSSLLYLSSKLIRCLYILFRARCLISRFVFLHLKSGIESSHGKRALFGFLKPEVMYCDFFHAGDRSSASAIKRREDFNKQRSKLSGSVLWHNLMLVEDSYRSDDIEMTEGCVVTLVTLEAYRKVREVVGFDTYVLDPRDIPEMWNFLTNTARQQCPDLCEANTPDASYDIDLPATTPNEDDDTMAGPTRKRTTNLEDVLEDGGWTREGNYITPTDFIDSRNDP